MRLRTRTASGRWGACCLLAAEAAAVAFFALRLVTDADDSVLLAAVALLLLCAAAHIGGRCLQRRDVELTKRDAKLRAEHQEILDGMKAACEAAGVPFPGGEEGWTPHVVRDAS